MGQKLKLIKKSQIRAFSSYLVVLLLFLSLINSNLSSGEKSSIKENDLFLNYTFSFEKPVLNDLNLNDETYTQISMKNCLSHGKPGDPALPVYLVKILIPPNKSVADIDLTYTDTIEIEYDLSNKPIVPQQNPITIGFDKKEVIFLMNSETYNSKQPIVDTTNVQNQIGYCRGYTILSAMINPVQYIPGDSKLSYHPEVTLNIELKDSQNFNTLYRYNKEDEEWVKRLVFNPELTLNYQEDDIIVKMDYPNGLCDPADEYHYVIITTTNGGLSDWTTNPTTPYNWTSLMNKHYTDDGLNCTLVTIQDIVNCSDYWNATALFNDTAALIREFCKDAYQDWGTSYILIGGDDDLIPAREMDYLYESNVDSDLYWSNLDNDFNSDQDGSWGEEGDNGFDLYSELYIGRLTCDVPQDVSNWMNKSFYYADSDDRDYLDNGGFYGGDTGWLTEGDDFVDFSAIQGTSDWMGPNPGSVGPYPTWLGFNYGFETWNSENPSMQFNLSVKWTAEPPNTGWSGGDETTAKAGFKDAINNDTVTLIAGIAHADEDMSLDVISSTWESDYHNTKPFFIHDYGCHCGDMDAADDGVLHSMLFHSDTELAFGCVYNTGYGWGAWDDTNASSAVQQKLFWDYFFDTTNNSGSTANWQLGKAMAYSKDTMAPTIDWTYVSAPGSWRGIIQGCLLFGDPAQKLRMLSNDSLQIDNENPSNGSIDVDLNPTLGVRVNDLNLALLNATWWSNSSTSWVQFGENYSINTSVTAVNITQENSNFSSYNTIYWWSVNLTNETNWLNETYHFTTRTQYIPNTPSGFTATTFNRSRIDLSWTNSGDNKTYIEYNSSSESWMRGEGIELDNSTNTSYQHTSLTFGTTYYYQAWSYNQTDNCWSTTNVSSNATTNNNNPPSLSGENPQNVSTNVDKTQSTVNVTITDLDGDTFNWTIQGAHLSDTGANGANNGSKSANLNTPLPYDTEIIWFVNVTDSYNATNATYNFTVRSQYLPIPPSSFSATAYNQSIIDLSWTNSGENKTYIEYNTTSETWPQGEGFELDNSTNTSYQHTSLTSGTTYYYQAWSYNQTDNCWSTTNVSDNATPVNFAPSIDGVNPQNGSNGQQRWSSCNITVIDVDNDQMNVYFFENTTGNWVLQQVNNSVSNNTNLIWSNYSNSSNYSTIYWWSVNVTDGYNWTNETFCFTTIENQAPTISNISPSNGSTGVSISTSSLSVTITDGEGDNFNWSIVTNPDIGSNSGNNASNGAKSCSISGLSYSSTYYWNISVIDTGNSSWINSTYSFTTEDEPSNGGNGNGGYPSIPDNNLPETPSIPSGPTSGYTSETYSYSTNATDSDDDQIKYKFDWGDGNISDWNELVDSGNQVSMTHSWSSNNTYYVKAIAKDENGGQSDWSDTLAVTIQDTVTNEDPVNETEPIVDVPENTTSNQTIEFNVSDIDGFEDENLTYYWEFGDGNIGIGKQPNHKYTTPGTYVVKLNIYDSNGTLIKTETFEIVITEESEAGLQETKEKADEIDLTLLFVALPITFCIFLIFIFRKRLTKIVKKDKEEKEEQED